MAEPVSEGSRRLAAVLSRHAIDLVLDIGAHRGEYGNRLRRAGYRGRIISFEPEAAAWRALCEAAADDPRWSVAPRIALGAAEGEAALNVSAEGGMSSLRPFAPGMGALLDSARFTNIEHVPMRRLDGVVADCVEPGHRLMLKLDVQGSEASVLDGAGDALSRIALIQLELSITPVYADALPWRAMIDRLATLGFEPVLFLPGYFNRRTARMIEMDGVFARTAPAA